MLASIIFMFTSDWKKKDEEHAEWDRRRRSSQEQVSETRDRDEALYICLDIPTLLANFWHATSTSFTFWCIYSIVACSDGREFQLAFNLGEGGECPPTAMKPGPPAHIVCREST